MNRKLVLALLSVAAFFVVSVAPAGADRPINSHNGGVIPMACGAPVGTVMVGFTTAGEWFHAAEPRLVVDSPLVLVAYAFHNEWTPIAGEKIVLDGEKNAPRNGRLTTCTMTVTQDDGIDDGTFVATYKV